MVSSHISASGNVRGYSLSISCKSSFNADKKSKQLTQSFEKRLGKAMEYEAGQIVARTEKGGGADGPLAEYAPSTLKQKLEQLGPRGAIVNLTKTGNMLLGMQSDVEENSTGLLGRIFFLPSEQQKARWNIALRPNFFQLSKEQLATIVRRLRGQ